MPLNAWIEPETDDWGAPTGLYSVHGDEQIWRYAQHAPLDIAWSMAKDLDPNAKLKKRSRKFALPFPDIKRDRRFKRNRLPRPQRRYFGNDVEEHWERFDQRFGLTPPSASATPSAR